MKIHREGYLILLITTLICVGIIFGAEALFPYSQIMRGIFAGLALVLFVLVLQFFRNPTRYTQVDEEHIIAPADGKVVVIEEVDEPEYFKEKRLQVSIFMSLFRMDG